MLIHVCPSDACELLPGSVRYRSLVPAMRTSSGSGREDAFSDVFLTLVYECSAYTWVCNHVCLVPQEVRRVCCVWTWRTEDCELSGCCWMLSPGPLQGQQVLLTPRHLSSSSPLFEKYRFVLTELYTCTGCAFLVIPPFPSPPSLDLVQSPSSRPPFSCAVFGCDPVSFPVLAA